MSERKIICQELKGLKKPLVERNETKTVVSVPKTKTYNQYMKILSKINF